MYGDWISKPCKKHNDCLRSDVVWGMVNLDRVECGCQEPIGLHAWAAIHSAKQERGNKQATDAAFGYAGPGAW